MNNYTALYEAAASLIPQESKIIEFGCGTGKFAKEYLKGKIKTYQGIDIDEESIAKAREAMHNFVVDDITKMEFKEPGCTFVALEVLEHLPLTEDISLLQRLPKGSRIIISVPSFDSEDHQRFFPNEWQAIHRYNTWIDIDFWRKIRIPTGAGYFHLMRGYR